MNIIEQYQVKAYYSSAVDPYNPDSMYLGGARTDNEIIDNYMKNLFEDTTKSEQATGIIKFKCFYFKNDTVDVYLKNPAVEVISDTTSNNDSVSVGWGSADIGDGQTTGIEQTILNENMFPTNVIFFSGNTRTTSAVLGDDIPPGKCKAVWVKLVSQFNAQDQPYNTFSLRLIADNLNPNTVRPVTKVDFPLIDVTVTGSCAADADFTKIANTMIDQNPAAIVTCGDNSVSNQPQFFIDSMKNYVNRLVLAFGVNDTTTARNLYIKEMNKYGFTPDLKNNYYSKNIGNLHFLIMDTSGETDYSTTSPQYQFVVNDLKSAYSNPNIDWIMVVTNAAMYASAATGSPRIINTYLRDHYHDIFTKYGVILVIQGGFHFYERTKVLGYNVLKPNEPVTFQYDEPSYTIQGRKGFADGSVYMVLGVGGANHDPVTAIAQYSNVYDYVDFGFLKIRVDNTGTYKTITIRFYNTARTSVIFNDEFTVTRLS